MRLVWQGIAQRANAEDHWSLLVRVIVFLIVGFPLAIWLGTMTWNRPAG